MLTIDGRDTLPPAAQRDYGRLADELERQADAVARGWISCASGERLAAAGRLRALAREIRRGLPAPPQPVQRAPAFLPRWAA